MPNAKGWTLLLIRNFAFLSLGIRGLTRTGKRGIGCGLKNNFCQDKTDLSEVEQKLQMYPFSFAIC